MELKIFKKSKILGTLVNILGMVVVAGVYLFGLIRYKSAVSQIVKGSTWEGAGVDLIALIAEAVHSVLPQIMFIILGLIILKIFMKLNDVEVRSAELLFQLLVFTVILALNTLIRLMNVQLTGVIIGNDMQAETLFKNVRNMINYCTGLDFAVNVNNMNGILRELILSINIFSIGAFAYLYNFLHKKIGKCVSVLAILIILYLILNTLLGGIDITSWIQWNGK